MRNSHLHRRSCGARRAALPRWLEAACAAALGLAPAAAALAADPEYTIQIKDHKFNPQELHVPAGRKLKIVVDNQEEFQEEFESYVLNREKHLPPRSKATLFIGPLQPGRYVYEGEDHSGTGAALGVIVAQ